MRSHRQIINAAGAAAVTEALAKVASVNTVRAWAQRNSIPAEFWPQVVEAGFATLEELAGAAEARKFPDLAEARESGAAA